MEALTREALEFLAGGATDDALALQRQFATANLAEIDYTGVGFFVRIEVPADAPRLSRNGVIGDVEPAKGDEALGLMLFIANGVASELEVVAYDKWPADLTGYTCRYLRWEDEGDGVRVATAVEHRDPDSMWT